MQTFPFWYMQVFKPSGFQKIARKAIFYEGSEDLRRWGKTGQKCMVKNHANLHKCHRERGKEITDSLVEVTAVRNKRKITSVRGISYAHFWLMFEDLQQMGVHSSSHMEWLSLNTVKWKTELLESPLMLFLLLDFCECCSY